MGVGRPRVTVDELAAFTLTTLDGDKGDITVSGSGATWTIDNDVVSNAKFRDSAALSVIGRSAASVGDPDDIAGTASQALQVNAAGTALAFASVDLSTALVTGDLPFSKLTQGSALSVLGVTGNATADVASIAAGSDHQVLRRSGTAVTFGAVNLAQAAAITGDLPFSALTQIAGLSILGVTGTLTADVAGIAGTANQVLLVNSGATALGFGQVNLASSAAVTGDLLFANLTQGSARSVLGVTGNSTADVASIQGTANQTLVVNAGGTTLTFGTLAVLGGGTGSTTAGGARTNLSAAASGANSDITSMTGLTIGGSSTTGTTVLVADINTTAVGNVGAGTDDLMSYTLPANALNANGKAIEVEAFGRTANNANAKSLIFNFGTSTTTITLTANQVGNWHFRGFITRTGVDAQDRAQIIDETTGGLSTNNKQTIGVATATEDDGATITIKFTAVATSNDDVTQEFMMVRFLN